MITTHDLTAYRTYKTADGTKCIASPYFPLPPESDDKYAVQIAWGNTARQANLDNTDPEVIEAAVRTLTDGLTWDLPGNPPVEDASLSVWFRGRAVMNQAAPLDELPGQAVALVARLVGNTLDELTTGYTLDDGRTVTRVFLRDSVGQSGYFAEFDAGRTVFLGWRKPTVGTLLEALARRDDGYGSGADRLDWVRARSGPTRR